MVLGALEARCAQCAISTFIPGDNWVTIKADDLWDAYKQIKERIGDDGVVVQLGFASHGSPGSWNNWRTLSPEDLEYCFLDGTPTSEFVESDECWPGNARALWNIGNLLSKDCKTTIMACTQARKSDKHKHLRMIARILRIPTYGNDNLIVVTGTGNWYLAPADGGKAKFVREPTSIEECLGSAIGTKKKEIKKGKPEKECRK